ncbi:hypothetical protein FRX31_035377 [Thalictrum thalictroides]|uniref:Uncharacterized protein n=1 Tax=Thalictrum thalictroides TaxID=46969 RepID=A0A7J6UR85_THATH|nr:hypothetical protein FRX31_035377 [Thalictrum thalictroides]
MKEISWMNLTLVTYPFTYKTYFVVHVTNQTNSAYMEAKENHRDNHFLEMPQLQTCLLELDHRDDYDLNLPSPTLKYSAALLQIFDFELKPMFLSRSVISTLTN